MTARTKKGISLQPVERSSSSYAAAGIAYAVHFANRQPSAGRTATALLILAALAHTFVIGMQTMEVRHAVRQPLARDLDVRLAAALSYYLETTTEERSMGVFIMPMLMGLQTIPALWPGVENVDPVLDSPWFWVHVSSLLFAYASFGLAGVLGLTYMVQFKEIKKKHLATSTRGCLRCRRSM